jgi:PAS domain S-box-containing protein
MTSIDIETSSAAWWLSPPAREHHFRSIADGIPALIALISPSGEVAIANRLVLEYFGATLDELNAWATADTLHPDDLATVLAARTESMATGQPYHVEGRHRGTDGEYRWFEMRGIPLSDSDGRIAWWYVIETDIDDSKRAHALLAGEVRVLEMVALGAELPQILDAICRLTEDTVSGCYCSVLIGVPGGRWRPGAAPSLPVAYVERLDGLPVLPNVGPCALAAHMKMQVIVPDIASDPRFEAYGFRELALSHGLRSCWATPILSRVQATLGTFTIYRLDRGVPTPVHRYLMRQCAHLAGIAIERAHGEDALKRSEALLAQAQHLSAMGSFAWRVATDEITWSRELYRIFGLEQGAPLTLDAMRDRVCADDSAWFSDMLARAQHTGSDFELEYRLQMSDQSVKYLHVVAQGTRDSDGQFEYIGTVQDVTERRRAEAALDNVRSALAHVSKVATVSALTASIAHEVSQPLAGIVTNASTCQRMLDADPPNVAGARETARRMIRDGHRAADVVTRLRALFGKKDTTSESVNLNDATREVIALSRTELQRARVTVRPELADDLPPVTGDRVQLQQVILNLLLNARDAMSDVHDRPRQVVIHTDRDGDDRVRLAVSDVGVGFPSRDVDHLFDAFYTTKSGGMGIGLSISRSIVEGHRGRMWASPNDGPGATFAFSIPV